MFTTVCLISITTYNDNFFLWWELKDLFLSNFQIYSRILLTRATVHGVVGSQTWLGNWTTIMLYITSPWFILQLDVSILWPLSSILPAPSKPPPLITTNLFSISMSQVLFWGLLQRRGGCLLFFCLKFYMWDHMLFIFVWLTSLSIMPSKSIHVVANGKVSFFIMVE